MKKCMAAGVVRVSQSRSGLSLSSLYVVNKNKQIKVKSKQK